MKKQTGIWLDLRNAWVIKLPTVPEGEVVVEHISSNIEESAPVGGTRSKTPWGPQGFDNQRSIEERRHQEEKSYFENILKHIHPTTYEVVIFGPSEAKYGLENLLLSQHHAPITRVESADKMTPNRMKAWVRNFFRRPATRRLAKFGQVHQ